MAEDRKNDISRSNSEEEEKIEITLGPDIRRVNVLNLSALDVAS